MAQIFFYDEDNDMLYFEYELEDDDLSNYRRFKAPDMVVLDMKKVIENGENHLLNQVLRFGNVEELDRLDPPEDDDDDSDDDDDE